MQIKPTLAVAQGREAYPRGMNHYAIAEMEKDQNISFHIVNGLFDCCI